MAVSLHQLLKTMLEMSGSDLHITNNSPPQIRVDGKLRPLDMPALTTVETKQIAYSVLTDNQKHRFEESLVGDRVLEIRKVVADVGDQFDQRHAEVGGIAFDERGIQLWQQIEQQLAKTGVVLGLIVE